jgi:pimeloyl-ACP methyl ester carboxylesterase
MTIVLVHGVPETAAVWDLLADKLIELGHEEPLRLSPPGFGAPVPDGWAATVHDYRAWLERELETVSHPVDLVGHDWGGGHVLSVAMSRPDLVRTWVSDVLGVFDQDYVWHDLAQQWQTPGQGEGVIKAMTGQPPEARAAALVGGGMHPAIAERVAPGIDDAMGSCILRLYRSATQPAVAQLGAHLGAAAARPGLAILPSEDHFVGTDEQRRRAARRAGAQIEVLDGLGHWWMTQDPDRAASVLNSFWADHP